MAGRQVRGRAHRLLPAARRPVPPAPPRRSVAVRAEGGERPSSRCETILNLQAAGLKTRLSCAHASHAVLGVSGGLDSTLALLVCARAFELLGLPKDGILAVSMPGFGTTGRTKSNAQKLAELLGASFREVPIGETVQKHFADIGHDPEKHDVTYENAQARERTQVLMDLANENGGLVIGTGDLSELALGWATYNGDHMSMYGVNGSIPKTLVRHLVRYAAQKAGESWKPSFSTCSTRRSARSFCRPSTATLRRKRRISSAPTSCTTSSSIICCASASVPAKFAVSPSPPLTGPTTPRRSEVAFHLLPPLLCAAVQALLPAGRPEVGTVALCRAATGACRAMLPHASGSRRSKRCDAARDLCAHSPSAPRNVRTAIFTPCGRARTPGRIIQIVLLNGLNPYQEQTLPVDTVYFGGGTPGLIGAGRIGRILAATRESFALGPGAEITVETNPGVGGKHCLTGLRRPG